ncbi:Do family serine endopeptidase [Candidatus Marinimicrobia bacterium]|jgi:serine protease Do|nr:Do family serine endopeptidase [Candidatus Neomarinimicrobiota bacterium]MDC0630716.1 Do family serine endopeptidase [Candidatus Neomarinimicrobiota bacterium]
MKIILSSLLLINFLFSQNSVVRQFSKAFADVAEKAKPAVVTIITDKIVSLSQYEDFGFFFYQPGQPRQKEFKTNAIGSGVIIDSKKGYILTNNHVIDDMDGIKVKLFDKREFEATIIGTDPKTDLAVLKIEANDLIDISLGNSDEARVGEWVMAVGSPFSENLSHTVTTGIISALGRSNIMNSQSYEDFIQTDAAINPGNSGGALISMDGKLIGINTAIATGGYEKSNRGVGFAIPSNMVKRIMSDLIDKGFVTRAWLGVFIQELDSETAKGLNIKTRNGALITDVVDGGPAQEGGIQEGDVIIAFNDQLISDPSNLKNVVSLTPPNTKNRVKVIRDGSKKTVEVILAELPDEVQNLSVRDRVRSNEFGLQLKEITDSLQKKYNLEDSNALVVTKIDKDGEAYNKGIREGDIVKRVGTEKVETVKAFKRLIDKSREKGTLLLLVKKPNGGSKFYTLKF